MAAASCCVFVTLPETRHRDHRGRTRPIECPARQRNTFAGRALIYCDGARLRPRRRTRLGRDQTRAPSKRARAPRPRRNQRSFLIKVIVPSSLFLVSRARFSGARRDGGAFDSSVMNGANEIGLDSSEKQKPGSRRLSARRGALFVML